jgi:hypothetical protein
MVRPRAAFIAPSIVVNAWLLVIAIALRLPTLPAVVLVWRHALVGSRAIALAVAAVVVALPVVLAIALREDAASASQHQSHCDA